MSCAAKQKKGEEIMREKRKSLRFWAALVLLTAFSILLGSLPTIALAETVGLDGGLEMAAQANEESATDSSGGAAQGDRGAIHGTDALEAGEVSELTAQATASGTWGTCPWEISSDGTLTIRPGEGASQEDLYISPWYEYADSIRKVVLAKSGTNKVKLPAFSGWLFASLHKASTFDLSGADVSDVECMDSMFTAAKVSRR